MKAYDYLPILSEIAPGRIVYGDEKLLKGSELYNGKTRCNMFTGNVLPCFTHSDFQNTYCIAGFCTTNRNKTSVYFDIFQGIMDGGEFSIILEGAIASGFIVEGDVLVLDNATTHDGLMEYLWRRYGIFLLFCLQEHQNGTIELLWNTLVQRHKLIPLCILREVQHDATTHAAHFVFVHSITTHKEADSYFKHCEKYCKSNYYFSK
jgi:hypothetical protein